MSSTPNTERLRKLVAHLRTGKLAHAKFDFGAYNDGQLDPITNCGTSGCAMGEVPAVWPETFAWADTWGVLYNGKRVPYAEAGPDFFCLSSDQYADLFNPNWHPVLSYESTKEEVALWIEQFCDRFDVIA